jgi:hypothetical protein
MRRRIGPIAEEAQKTAEEIEKACIRMLKHADELVQDRARLVIECARILNLHKMIIDAFIKEHEL